MYKIVLTDLQKKYNIKPIDIAYYQIAIDDSFNKDKTILTLVKREDYFVLDIALDFNYSEKYYISGKYEYEDGVMTEWSEPVVITRNSLKVVYEDMIIKPPKIELIGSLEQLKYGGYIIKANGFRCVNGDARHTATDYIIKDYAGRTLWSSLNDKEHLYNIKVPDNVLQGIDPYYIYVRFVTDRGTSPWRRVKVSTDSIQIPENISCDEKIKYYEQYIVRLLKELALTEICKTLDYST